MSLLARILCPIDFDERSGRAMAWAEDLALRHGAELRLLHVLPARAESVFWTQIDRNLDKRSCSSAGRRMCANGIESTASSLGSFGL
jgi:hypothetical protein